MIAEAKRVGIREVVSKGDTAARLLATMESLLPGKIIGSRCRERASQPAAARGGEYRTGHRQTKPT
jgi:hypothetical protein